MQSAYNATDSAAEGGAREACESAHAICHMKLSMCPLSSLRRCLPAGGTLLLQDVLLCNASLTSPSGNPSLVLLPSALQLPVGALLKLRDVMLFVSQDTLQQYIGFMLGVPQVGWCCLARTRVSACTGGSITDVIPVHHKHVWAASAGLYLTYTSGIVYS